MNKYQLYVLGGALLAATSLLSACVTPQIQANATPEQIASAKAAATQANFDKACKYASGAESVTKPIFTALAPKLGADGALALDSFLLLIDTTCSAPLDITNADAIIQRVYDAGGNIVALVIKAQSS